MVKGRMQFIVDVIYQDYSENERERSIYFEQRFLEEFRNAIKRIKLGDEKGMFIQVTDISQGNVC